MRVLTVQSAVLFTLRPAVAAVAFAGDTAERAALAFLDRALADGLADRVAERIVDGPEIERVVDMALASPAVERMLTRVVASHIVREAVDRVADDVMARLRDSEAMWALIDEIARSPAVTEAIAHQGAGFADQVSDDVRERSRNADVRLERAAWRLLRRRPAVPAPEPTTSGAV
jgi:hypothetical protein